MKILVAPMTVQITSKLSRTTRQPRPTNRPPCFSEIYIDCTDMSIYLVFSDASIYRYDPDSVDTGRAIIDALCHGLTFNQAFRLFGISGGVGAYERVASIPATATLRYQFPPYAGTDPGPCPTNIFDKAVWTNLILGTGASAYALTPATGTMLDTGTSTVTATVPLDSASVQNNFTLPYAGLGGTATVNWSITITGAVFFGQSGGVNILQGGTVILVHNFNTTGSFGGTDNPVIVAGGGGGQDLSGQVVCNVGVSNAGSPTIAVSMEMILIQ
jgi:hypothetical protein